MTTTVTLASVVHHAGEPADGIVPRDKHSASHILSLVTFHKSHRVDLPELCCMDRDNSFFVDATDFLDILQISAEKD